jgi:hypothetical protein
VDDTGAPYGRLWQATGAGASLEFAFEGTGFYMDTRCPLAGGTSAGEGATCGSFRVAVDNRPPVVVAAGNAPAAPRGFLAALPFGRTQSAVAVAVGMPAALHKVRLEALPEPGDGPPGLAALVIK